MQTVEQKSGGRLRWFLLGGGAVIAICCLCAVLVFFTQPPTRSVVSTATPYSLPTLEETDAPSAAVTTVTPAPTRTETVVLGQTRDQPAPKNSTVDIGGGMQVTILQVTRPADDIVAQGNMFNPTAIPDREEYLMVKLYVECMKPSNETCSFNSYEFKTVGANGQVHDQAFVAGIPLEFESFAEMFGGSALDGQMVFLVPKGDPDVVLFHDPLIFGDPVYIALK